MGHGIYTATAGAIARRSQLDITANNMANATTTGYRAQRVTFQEVFQDTTAPTRHLVAVGRPVVSRERGPVERTARPLDMTLQEEGFFVAEDGLGRVLLRSVSAHLDPDGSLRDPAGRRLALAGGFSSVDPSRPLEIGEHGQIVQDGREVARLLVVDVRDPRGLAPVGAGAYTTTLDSGEAFPVAARVEAGALEKSNVNPVAHMVRMIALEREYQSLTRVINAYQEADEGIIAASSPR